MTTTPNTYPTEWHMIDAINNIECRQMSYDSYQLRSRVHTITINKEGLDLFRESMTDTYMSGTVGSKWNKYLRDNYHNIKSEPRDDV